MANLPKILVPSIVGVSVYLLVNKFFPEPKKIEVGNLEKNPIKNLRGGDSLSRMRLVKHITQKLLKDRSLKLALISVFVTAGIQHFQAEIEALLVSEVMQVLSENGLVEDGQLKIVCDIVQEHDLAEHTKSLRELIVAQNLTNEQKVSLLKIKLDFIINGECSGRRRFFVMMILGTLLAVTLSGIGGLTLILEALYQLFREGKITGALYKQIIKALTKKFGAVPAEYLVE